MALTLPGCSETSHRSCAPALGLSLACSTLLLVASLSLVSAVDLSHQLAALLPQHGGATAPLDASDLKIFIYKHPAHIPQWEHKWSHWEQRWYEEWIRGSKHFTTNGSEAHYFWIPYFKCVDNTTAGLEVFKYIREDYPFWNATKNRHILMTTFDLGPGNIFGESWFGRPDLPDDINPLSPSRNVIYMHYHGLRDGFDSGGARCWVCFQQGKDIMLPKDQGVCGPLCGYEKAALMAKSMWSPSAPTVRRPRKYLMFYGGSIGWISTEDFSGRGGVYVRYKNHSDYLIINHLPPDNERVDFSEAMQDAEFCYSPLGGGGGPTDRYIAALMFGCIPVFLSTSINGERMAQPYDELIPWQLFSTRIDFKDLPHLDTHLRMLLPHVAEMRRHMAQFVWQLLYTSRYGSYFGEAPGRDAPHTLIQVLHQRLQPLGLGSRGRRAVGGRMRLRGTRALHDRHGGPGGQV